jgi:transcriptional regulator with XRE-family HTH domain
MNTAGQPARSTRVRIRIRDIAEARGITPTALARAAGLHPQTVRAFWKDPYRKTSTRVLGKIAEALNVSLAELLEEHIIPC